MNKWTRDYDWESIMDYFTDDYEESLQSVMPKGDALGTIRVTVEFIPPEEEEDE